MGNGIQRAYPAQDTAVFIAGFVPGVMTDAEKLATHVVGAPFSLPVDLTGSVAHAEVVATAAAVIDVQKNGTPIGSIDFALGANTATFTFATEVSFEIGDRLNFLAQATADTTLADVSFTLKGELS